MAGRPNDMRTDTARFHSDDGDKWGWLEEQLGLRDAQPGLAKLPGAPMIVSNPAYPDEQVQQGGSDVPLPPSRPQPRERYANTGPQPGDSKEESAAPASQRSQPQERAPSQTEAPVPPRRPDYLNTGTQHVSERVASRGTPSGRGTPNAEPSAPLPMSPDVAASEEYAREGNVPKDGYYGSDRQSGIDGPVPSRDDISAKEIKDDTSWRNQVSAANNETKKLEAAGIDPASIGNAQRVRIGMMGIDKWIAEQQRSQMYKDRRQTESRAAGAQAAKK